ncbi:penicillin-binding protein 2 [Pseudonocardia sp. N23]|uniref:peptidoglycan D,D-transpeptidase FtsI family protein n=1 Tax=Pseudonocardia sp. N23 TaxID=1987376 RepID=UPI000BFD880F|nr:penicillin-binding protein 2 [Pseudonocardia sp. N23]GAY08398.1 cell division protein FtsI [Pseudonocardia sp. N23]
MNNPVRKIAVSVMVMILLLFANLTYVQVVKADDYRTDSRNQRTAYAEYSRQRGQITADGKVLAQSVATDDRLRYQRQYPGGPAFASVTGYLSLSFGRTGIEGAADSVLNGTDDRLFVRRLSDLITGRDPRGGNVSLTILPTVQQVAYDQLTQKGYAGSVVALQPQTGEILAMVSTPAFDPNLLASHNDKTVQDAWNADNAAQPQVLLNRAISVPQPPGSTFKVVDTAAALQNGSTPDTLLTAQGDRFLLDDGVTTMDNYNKTQCGTGTTTTLRDAFARSCNTAFADLVRSVGVDGLRKQAEAFGIGQSGLAVPMKVTPSTIGNITSVTALQQSAIGQKDVKLTPLQNAMVVSAVANGGQLMAPYLIKEIQGPELDTVDTTEPDRIGQAVPAGVAATLTDLMIGSENRTQGGGKIAGIQIASKTGTAELNSKADFPLTWYVAFAPAEKPTVAIAVLVEDGGDLGLEATGGSIAAPIGRAVIAEALKAGR